MSIFFFFFNDTATTEIYTLSLHDALPIYLTFLRRFPDSNGFAFWVNQLNSGLFNDRSEEHTSELQSRRDLVCRLLLEKKKIKYYSPAVIILFRFVLFQTTVLMFVDNL